MRARLVPLSAFLLLAACAGPPGPIYVPFGQAGGYGYAEEQLSETRLRVRYEAPTRTAYDVGRTERERAAAARVTLAYDMALRRAAELALARGFRAFAVTERQNDVLVDVAPDYPFYPHGYSPFLFHGPLYRRHFGHHHLHHYPHFLDRNATVGAGVTLLVELRRTDGPDALDAKATLARLQAKYPDAAPAPVG